MESPQPPRRGDGRMAFFAHRTEIQQLIHQGMSVIGVYRELESKLGITYSQFTRYVKSYIEKPGKLNVGMSAPLDPPSIAIADLIPPAETPKPTPPEEPIRVFQKASRIPDMERLV